MSLAESANIEGIDKESICGISEKRGKVWENNKEAARGEKPSVPPTIILLEGANRNDEEKKEDLNQVGWDGDDDLENPMNWPKWKRMLHVQLGSFIVLLTSLAASMFAPGVPELMKDFHNTNPELASFVVSVYVLGFAFGPLLIAPLSELYGRLPVYWICNLMFLSFTIACAKSTGMAMEIVFRFFQGFAGCAPLVVAGGTIADVIPQEKRGGAMAIFALGPLLGPIIGPVGGGYLAQDMSWRWAFWILAIASGVVTILCFLFMRETYAVVLLERKAARLRQKTGNEALRSVYDRNLTPGKLFKQTLIRPLKLLFLSPIVLSLCTYAALGYAYIFILFTTFTIVFMEQYGFNQGNVGLTFLGLGVGTFLGLVVFALTSDRLLKKHAAKSGGEMKPEFRLPLMMAGGPLLSAGLFWYGWSAEGKAHWMVTIVATGCIGVGLFMTFMPAQTYLVDAFPLYAASALAANALFRSLFGALIPLVGNRMYDNLGLGWGNSLLGFISVAFIPVPWFLYRYGEWARKRWPVNL